MRSMNFDSDTWMPYMVPGSLIIIYPSFKKIILEDVVSSLVWMYEHCIKGCWQMQYLFLFQT